MPSIQKLQQKQNQINKPPSFNTQKPKNTYRSQLRQLINESMNQSRYSQVSQSSQDILTQGKQKLIDLTRQCSNYFQKFTIQNDNYTKTIIDLFNDCYNNIQSTFNEIKKSMSLKLEQLKNNFKAQETRIVAQRKQQEQDLNALLMKIHTIHLTKIEQNDIVSNQCLTEYAFTLNQFFNKMQDIQSKINQDKAEDRVKYVKNQIKDQLMILIVEKFNNHHAVFKIQAQNCFTFQDQSIKHDETQVNLQDCSTIKSNAYFNTPINNNIQINNELYEQLQKIKQNHLLRQQRIKDYNLYIYKNPFTSVKLKP